MPHPFGLQACGPDHVGTDLSFTGMNSDTSAGLYDFLYREYSTQGRWPRPDPAGLNAVDKSNPQTWNRYAYVSNRPTSLVDPLGDCQVSRSGLVRSGCSDGINFGGGDEGFGGGCSLDGVDIGCGFGGSLLGSSGVSQCPMNECSGVGTDPQRQRRLRPVLFLRRGIEWVL